MSQFIIATNNTTAEQRNAITEYLKSKGWAWWHHFEHLWMAATAVYGAPEYDSTTPQQIWNELTNIPVIGAHTFLVIIRLPSNGQPSLHYGFGPPAGWEWTKKYLGPVG